MPLLAGPDDAVAATAAVQVVNTLGNALGPLICAPLLLVVSAIEIMLFNGITFVINALILTRVPLRTQTHSRKEHVRAWPNLIADIRAGLRTVARDRIVSRLLVLIVLLFFIAALQNVGQPVLVLGKLHGSSSTYSFLIMVNEIGFAVGTVFCPSDATLSTLLRRFQTAMFVMALAAAGYALAGTAWLTAVPFLLAGIGNTIIVVVAFTIYVKVTSGEFLGRIYGVHTTSANAAIVASFAVSGPIIGALGVREAFRLEAVGIAAALILGIILLRPFIGGSLPAGADLPAPAAVEER